MRRRVSLAVASAALAVALAACSKAQVDSTQNAMASAVPKAVDDVGIAAQIEGRFALIDPSSALHVAVDVNGGDVALSGKVRNAAVERRFVAAATGVHDVAHVASKLTLDGSLPNVREDLGDVALEASIRAKLVEQAGANGVKVHVVARNGAVTLSGEIPSASIETTLIAATKSVRGVTSVRNALAVAP